MDPLQQCCPNASCSSRGLKGTGNIGIHSRKERRYLCHVCGKTFAQSKGTLFYRRQYASDFISQMLTLLAYGCPLQAMVAAFGLDERTLSAWQKAAGAHCLNVHDHLVTGAKLDLIQVQADELRIKIQGAICWMALSLCVPTRLWLGGVVAYSRDTFLVYRLALKVKACALCRPVLICFDGFTGYIKAFREAFRSPLHTGKRGRPALVAWPHILLGRVIKRYNNRRLLEVERQLIQGEQHKMQTLLKQSGSRVLNTAFLERLNATFRACLAPLVRRSRQIARTISTLDAGMYLTGCVYNFCTYHKSLRLPLYLGSRAERRWVGRTPAMAAGLTDHRWSVSELLWFKIPPPPYQSPKRRGRPPKNAENVQKSRVHD